MIYNLAGLFGINFSIEQALRSMMGSILALIYSLIDYLYNVFVYLSKAQILDNEFVQSIYSKVGMILGIFMIFKLIFSLIQSLIDPNKFTDKKNGFASIIFRSVVSIVLLGVTPAIFKEAFKLQNIIVGGDTSDNVIYKLIAGNSSVGNLDNMGRVISSDLYFSFFTDDEDPYLNNGTADIFDYIDADELQNHSYDRFLLDDFDNLRKNVTDGDKSFHDTVSYLALKQSSTEQYVIEFNWLLALVVGCFVVYIIAMYCVQVAIRVVQLAYLQLIAPIPILSYITDPDGSFKKWTSQCIATFLDLFLRMAVIYFVITMIGDVLTQFRRTSGIIFETTGLPSDSPTLVIVKIFIIIGLLLFAQKVPQLLNDLFPNLGKGAGKFSFGLNPKKEVFDPLKKVADSPIGRLATKPIKWAGGKAAAPIKKAIETSKTNRKARIEGNTQAREDRAKYNRGNGLYKKYGDNIKDAFSGDFADTYNELKTAKKNAGEMDNIFNAASDELKEARKVGGTRLIEAQNAYNDALKNKRDADKYVEEAKKRHDTNRKRFTKQAQMEDDYGYYVTRKAISGLGSGSTQSNASTSSNSNGGQPIASGSSTSSNANTNSVVDRVNNITGVNRSAASENGAPTAENSLMAQLAEQAHQQEMQQEFMNRGTNDSAVVLPPTEEQMDNYIASDVTARDYNYQTQDSWDERIEFATEKLQNLANNGASDKEIAYQMKVLESLEAGKKQSADKDRQSAENVDIANEQFRDDWMSQGGADDSDNW